MEIELKQGDLMYFPRGTIHEVERSCSPLVCALISPGKQARASNSASVHVTISTHQRWALADLLQVALPRAIEVITARERPLIEASKRPGFSVDDLRAAMREAEDIH